MSANPWKKLGWFIAISWGLFALSCALLLAIGLAFGQSGAWSMVPFVLISGTCTAAGIWLIRHNAQAF